MRVKTFEAASMQEALNIVKQDMGEEAFILSTRTRHHKAANGLGEEAVIEVTAAVDEPLQPAPSGQPLVNGLYGLRPPLAGRPQPLGGFGLDIHLGGRHPQNLRNARTHQRLERRQFGRLRNHRAVNIAQRPARGPHLVHGFGQQQR